jgi:hypothetical protein
MNVVIYSEDLTKDDLRLLLQSIRDCEQNSFPDKTIVVAVFVPELSTQEITEILSQMKPPFKQGPVVLAGVSNKGKSQK